MVPLLEHLGSKSCCLLQSPRPAVLTFYHKILQFKLEPKKHICKLHKIQIQLHTYRLPLVAREVRSRNTCNSSLGSIDYRLIKPVCWDPNPERRREEEEDKRKEVEERRFVNDEETRRRRRRREWTVTVDRRKLDLPSSPVCHRTSSCYFRTVNRRFSTVNMKFTGQAVRGGGREKNKRKTKPKSGKKWVSYRQSRVTRPFRPLSLHVTLV